MLAEKFAPGKIIKRDRYYIIQERNATATFDLRKRRIVVEPAFDPAGFDLYRYVFAYWVKQVLAIHPDISAMFAMKWLWPIIQQSDRLILKPYLQIETEVQPNTALKAVAFHIFNGDYLRALKILLFSKEFNPYVNYSLYAIGYDYLDLANYLFANFGNPSDKQVIVKKAMEYKEKHQLPDAKMLWHNYSILKAQIQRRVPNPSRYWESKRIQSRIVYSEQNLINRINNGLGWLPRGSGIYYPIMTLPTASLAYLSANGEFKPISVAISGLKSATSIFSISSRLSECRTLLGYTVFMPAIVLSQFQENWTAPFLPFGPSSLLSFLLVLGLTSDLDKCDVVKLIRYLKRHEDKRRIIPFYMEP